MEPALSLINVFLGIEGSTEELGLKKQNLWAYSSSSMVEDLNR